MQDCQQNELLHQLQGIQWASKLSSQFPAKVHEWDVLIKQIVFLAAVLRLSKLQGWVGDFLSKYKGEIPAAWLQINNNTVHEGYTMQHI